MIIIESERCGGSLYHSLFLCMFESFHNEKFFKRSSWIFTMLLGGFLWSV